MSKKKLTFEQGLNRLEVLAELMEKNDTPLEQAVKLYKEALELSLYCGESLNSIEKEVMVLQQTGANAFQKKAFHIKIDEDDPNYA